MNAIDPGLGLSEQPLMTMFDTLATAIDNSTITAPGLTQGTSTATSFKVANSTTYRSSGKIKVKASAEVAGTAGNGSFTGVQDVTPNASTVQERVFMLTVDGSGTLGVVAGTQATGSGNAALPERPAAGTCPLGYCRIAVAAGATGFQMGTSNPTTSGAITATYTDGYPLPRFSTAQ